jgi:hypothetical protein
VPSVHLSKRSRVHLPHGRVSARSSGADAGPRNALRARRDHSSGRLPARPTLNVSLSACGRRRTGIPHAEGVKFNSRGRGPRIETMKCRRPLRGRIEDDRGNAFDPYRVAAWCGRPYPVALLPAIPAGTSLDRSIRVSTPSGSEADHDSMLRIDPVATARGTDTPGRKSRYGLGVIIRQTSA